MERTKCISRPFFCPDLKSITCLLSSPRVASCLSLVRSPSFLTRFSHIPSLNCSLNVGIFEEVGDGNQALAVGGLLRWIWNDWQAKWRRSLDGWWAGLSPATAARLQGCTAFLGGALSTRFASWMAQKRVTGAGGVSAAAESTATSASPPSPMDSEAAACETVVDSVKESLPDFPDRPTPDFNAFDFWPLPAPLPRDWLLPPRLEPGLNLRWSSELYKGLVADGGGELPLDRRGEPHRDPLGEAASSGFRRRRDTYGDDALSTGDPPSSRLQRSSRTQSEAATHSAATHSAATSYAATGFAAGAAAAIAALGLVACVPRPRRLHRARQQGAHSARACDAEEARQLEARQLELAQASWDAVRVASVWGS